MKLILRPEEATQELGGRVIYLRMLKAGWIKPVEQTHRLTTFSGYDIQKAANRYVSGEKLPK